MKLKVNIDSSYHLKDIERDDKVPDWIEKHKQANQGKFPLLPEFLADLVNEQDDSGHWNPRKKGKLISPGLQVIPVSGQQWQRMTASEQAQLLELVEWLGQQTAEDYCRNFESMYPRTPDFAKRGKV